MNRKDGQPDVDVFVFVIDSWPAVRRLGVTGISKGCFLLSLEPNRVAHRCAPGIPCDSDSGVRDEFEADGAVSEAAFAHGRDGLVQAGAGRAVLVKEVAGEEEHVDLRGEFWSQVSETGMTRPPRRAEQA